MGNEKNGCSKTSLRKPELINNVVDKLDLRWAWLLGESLSRPTMLWLSSICGLSWLLGESLNRPTIFWMSSSVDTQVVDNLWLLDSGPSWLMINNRDLYLALGNLYKSTWMLWLRTMLVQLENWNNLPKSKNQWDKAYISFDKCCNCWIQRRI